MSTKAEVNIYSWKNIEDLSLFDNQYFSIHSRNFLVPCIDSLLDANIIYDCHIYEYKGKILPLLQTYNGWETLEFIINETPIEFSFKDFKEKIIPILPPISVMNIYFPGQYGNNIGKKKKYKVDSSIFWQPQESVIDLNYSDFQSFIKDRYMPSTMVAIRRNKFYQRFRLPANKCMGSNNVHFQLGSLYKENSQNHAKHYLDNNLTSDYYHYLGEVYASESKFFRYLTITIESEYKGGILYYELEPNYRSIEAFIREDYKIKCSDMLSSFIRYLIEQQGYRGLISVGNLVFGEEDRLQYKNYMEPLSRWPKANSLSIIDDSDESTDFEVIRPPYYVSNKKKWVTSQ